MCKTFAINKNLCAHLTFPFKSNDITSLTQNKKKNKKSFEPSEPTLKSWKLVVLFLGAVFHLQVSFMNAHLCVFMSVLYRNVCISEMNYDLVDLNNDVRCLTGVLPHTPKPNPSESSAVVKNKHCATELSVKTGGDRRNFGDAFAS